VPDVLHLGPISRVVICNQFGRCCDPEECACSSSLASLSTVPRRLRSPERGSSVRAGNTVRASLMGRDRPCDRNPALTQHVTSTPRPQRFR
jgi:hypothetical protein